ncbi:MAG: hypothetical protein COU98_01830 [Candidatus Staskawiczbacteria bacterium CG10_big_fil_rev_8_21_14_0_10_38_10]|uniref:Cell division protein FtsL n=1 Tax=Candidatus Staskawiczbacteria bacterium CG10_big_fil_rev_8_21_14_0_10_38_10 TaxID=1974891 RepID=A0A2H9T151_9BACT|nr:MAG: hypothetical protein COU98_01830 [Candidatus Staskawiczbacteria bacterium CG10_big_fil_rev_8_21_14_0_10_38_10]
MNHTIALNPYILLKNFTLGKKINLKMFWVFNFVIIISLLVFYVLQVNEITRESYLIKNHLETLENLSQESKVFEINFAQNSSLENIKKMAEELNFGKVDRVKYIQVLEGVLVTK